MCVFAWGGVFRFFFVFCRGLVAFFDICVGGVVLGG